MSGSIVHIIVGLNDGGAEAVLYRLCQHDRTGNKHFIVSMMDEGKYGPLLKLIGVDVYCLSMPQGRPSLRGILMLYGLLRKLKPDVVQTWMYHADLIGGSIAKISNVKRIIWGVHHTDLERDKAKRTTILIAKACSLLSGLVPNKIIYCAVKSEVAHTKLGYRPDKGIVICNGYDLEQYTIDRDSRLSFRSELRLLESEILIGMVGRFSPEKDHQNLIAAISFIKQSNSPFKLILVGRGLTESNVFLMNLLKSEDLLENVLLLGQRTDIAAVMNGIDIHILSSSTEGFPNVLAEAMACGTPCVSTDVGDASQIVGETGWIVPAKDSRSLANAILEGMNECRISPESWLHRQQACRNRIYENFSIEKMVLAYQSVWGA